MSTLMTLLHDPATKIAIGVGFFILMLAIAFFVIKNKAVKSISDVVADEEVDNSLAFLSDNSQVEASISGPSETSTPPPFSEPTILYNAMAFTDEGIKFKTIKKKLLTLIYCDPSMPKHGSRFLCVEKEGEVKAFDPRDTSIESNDTAQRAWRATHCYDIVKAMFQAPATGWEKLNQVFMWVFCGGLLFLGIIALSRI